MKVGIIGCGAVFENFYRDALVELQARGVISVALLMDRMDSNVERALEHFPKAEVAQDLSSELLLRSKIDRALVLTPPSTHADIILQLAAAGVHIYCEKPLTTSPREALDISRAFSVKGLICKVGYVRRLFPNFRMFRNLYSSLGPERELSLSDGEVFRWPIKTGSIFSPDDPGAGVVWDKLSHNLDMVQWIAGLREITSVQSNCQPGRVPADVMVEGRTDHGTFRVAVSWTAVLPNMVSASDGLKQIRCKNGLAQSVSLSPEGYAPSPVEVDVLSYAEAVKLALKEFFRLQTKEEPSLLATVEESVDLTDFLFQINASARVMKS